MDGLTAKRILIALARKLGFDNANIVKCSLPSNTKYWQLILIRRSPLSKLTLCVKDNLINGQDYKLISTSPTWESFLKLLEGHVVPGVFNDTDILVKSIEQLIIDLELEGFLKNI